VTRIARSSLGREGVGALALGLLTTLALAPRSAYG
jgi:hypothetical protein